MSPGDSPADNDDADDLHAKFSDHDKPYQAKQRKQADRPRILCQTKQVKPDLRDLRRIFRIAGSELGLKSPRLAAR